MGFNMSWIFVDGIDQGALYEALDLAQTDEVPDQYDLGTSYVPLAGATLKSGWSAVFAKYALWTWRWAQTRRVFRACQQNPGA